MKLKTAAIAVGLLIVATALMILGLAIYRAKPLKCISYLEGQCIKAVPDK